MKKTFLLLIPTAVILLTTLSSCKVNSKNSISESLQEVPGDDALNFALGSVSGALDELSSPQATKICGKATGQNCTLGTGLRVANNAYQLIEYKPACDFKGLWIEGTVRIDANRIDCQSPSVKDDILVLSQNTSSYVTKDGIQTKITSERKTTGPSTGIGGGFTFTYGGRLNTYSVRIGGFHKQILNGEDTRSDRTLSSVTPLELITESFDRSQRLIKSGSVVAVDNLLRGRMLYTFKNVSWAQEECCHPTSGTLEVENLNDESNSSFITFSTRCGDYTEVLSDSSVQTGTLTSCGNAVF
jgi:hypothetical protein